MMKNQKIKTLKRNQPKKSKTNHVQLNTFGEHISELRRRFFYVGIFFLLGSALAYTYRQELLQVILAPLQGQQLVYLTIGGGFSFIFQVSIYAGLIVAMPALVYHIHAFIRPALPAKAQKSVTRITLFSSVLISAGIMYGYFVAIPSAIRFLNTFAEGAVTPNLTAESYLSFFLAYLGGLAALSLLPLLLLFWHWISPLSPKRLLASEQWVVLLAFVLAALITPTPDIFNQVMIAGPVIVIYQIGVVIILISHFKNRKKTSQSTVATARSVSTLPSTAILPVPIDHRPQANVSHAVPAVPHIVPRHQGQTRRPVDGFSLSPTSRLVVVARPAVPVRPRLYQPPTRSARIRLSIDGVIAH